MTKFELKIKNPDGSPYWLERFNSKADLNRWLKEEQTRPYWKKDFQVEVVDNTEALAKIEADARAAAEAEDQAQKKKRKEARQAVKAFREKPTKTVADLVKLLEALIEVIDLKAGDDEVETLKG